jgi:hypothetical protein
MATTAKETKKQENGSLMVFESFIEKNKIPKVEEILETVYPDMPGHWYITFELQAKALKGYIGSQKNYVYSRDNGIMPFLEKAAREMGVSTKDKWNPMDIVMVKKSDEKIVEKEVEKILKGGEEKEAKLERLNELMQKRLIDKSMIPISLKGLAPNAKVAKLEEANLGKKKEVKFKLKPNSLYCDLDMENPPLFDTGEFSLRFFAGESEYALQVRSFRYSIPTTGPQTDITPKSGGAKLGKSSVAALRPFVAKLNLEMPPSPVKDPKITISGKFTEPQIYFWTNLYDTIKNQTIAGQKVNWDIPLTYGGKPSSFRENLENGLKNFESDRNTLGRIYSKLYALRTIELYMKIDRKKMFEEWLETLYYGAKKEFSNLNGPFIKIF